MERNRIGVQCGGFGNLISDPNKCKRHLSGGVKTWISHGQCGGLKTGNKRRGPRGVLESAERTGVRSTE